MCFKPVLGGSFTKNSTLLLFIKPDLSIYNPLLGVLDIFSSLSLTWSLVGCLFFVFLFSLCAFVASSSILLSLISAAPPAMHLCYRKQTDIFFFFFKLNDF